MDLLSSFKNAYFQVQAACSKKLVYRSCPKRHLPVHVHIKFGPSQCPSQHGFSREEAEKSIKELESEIRKHWNKNQLIINTEVLRNEQGGFEVWVAHGDILHSNYYNVNGGGTIDTDEKREAIISSLKKVIDDACDRFPECSYRCPIPQDNIKSEWHPPNSGWQ